MPKPIPTSVRYIKNGQRGAWWKAAKADQQLHAGWREVPDELLLSSDLQAIKPFVQAIWKGKQGETQDFNALQTLLDRPSKHVWITFEDDCLWWCTVSDKIEVNPLAESKERGHFWLTCTRPWSNLSVDGKRRLAKSELPGTVTAVAGFRATVCVPRASEQILRIIRNEEDPDVRDAARARGDYHDAIAKLVARLGPKDFEILIDLILARTGWARLAKVGETRADIDIEVENAAIDEIAFVQVKSTASQSTLNRYVAKFREQSERYDRMIFVVHSPQGTLTPPVDHEVQIWERAKIAELTVKHGLGDWVSSRL